MAEDQITVTTNQLATMLETILKDHYTPAMIELIADRAFDKATERLADAAEHEARRAVRDAVAQVVANEVRVETRVFLKKEPTDGG